VPLADPETLPPETPVDEPETLVSELVEDELELYPGV
jgi:hypothetical protein